MTRVSYRPDLPPDVPFALGRTVCDYCTHEHEAAFSHVDQVEGALFVVVCPVDDATAFVELSKVEAA